MKVFDESQPSNDTTPTSLDVTSLGEQCIDLGSVIADFALFDASKPGSNILLATSINRDAFEAFLPEGSLGLLADERNFGGGRRFLDRDITLLYCITSAPIRLIILPSSSPVFRSFRGLASILALGGFPKFKS